MTWLEVRERVLSIEPKSEALLDFLGQYWNDTTFTEAVANQFIRLVLANRFDEAEKLIFESMTPDDLIEAFNDHNKAMAKMVAEEKKLHDFLGDAKALLIKIALAAALAMVGL